MADQKHKGVLTPEAFEIMRERAKIVDTWPDWKKGSPRNERTAPQPETSRSASRTSSTSHTIVK